MSQPEDILALVQNEVVWRLGKNKCPECGRGDEAHQLGATALSQMLTGLSRIEIAKTKQDSPDSGQQELDPFSLLVSARKLPWEHPKRQEVAAMVEGYMARLQKELDGLRREADPM